MDTNTDQRIVVMDRAQFDKLRNLAYRGAHEDGRVDSFEAILRHVHKFNWHIPDDDDGEAANYLRTRRQMAQAVRRLVNAPRKQVFLQGSSSDFGGPKYLIPVTVVGRDNASSGDIPMVVIEFQPINDYQRAAFIELMRCCATARDGHYPMYQFQTFNGQRISGQARVSFACRWSHRQHERLYAGKDVKLYAAVEALHLTDELPGNYRPCTHSFSGFYYQQF